MTFTEVAALEPSSLRWGPSATPTTAAAETVIGLCKNEAVAKNSAFITGPLKTLADVEKLTFDWLDWYKNRRAIQHPQQTRLPNMSSTIALKQTAR